MRLLVDSAFVIDYLKGDPGAVSRWAEVFGHGDDPGDQRDRRVRGARRLRECDVAAFAAFIEPVEFVQPGPEQALLAGQWRARARAASRSLSLADALIAAAAVAVDAAVLTRNVRDFVRTPVRIETY